MFKFLSRCSFLFILVSSFTLAEVQWKTEDEIRDLYGEPIEISGPVGTHASYQLWSYEGFYVAFSDGRAFHRFDDVVSSEIEQEDF